MPVKVAVVGLGQRGTVYSKWIADHPEVATIVAVAEPRPHRLLVVAQMFGLSDRSLFHDWKDLFNAPRQADAVIISVLDSMHAELVEQFASAGYHILCEKPLATSIEDCVKIYRIVQKSNIVFGVGHVLRYTPYNLAVRKVLDSGILGDIVNIQHMEPIGFDHFAHSYVRGNWKKTANTSFSLMTKCCHDLDILAFYMGGSNQPKAVSSFGSLFHFKPANKPKEAEGATNCLNCAAESRCPYSAKKAYINPLSNGSENRANRFVNAAILDIENVTSALKDGPYGLCVYQGQNDVVDHQVVNIEYTNGATASLCMSAFAETESESHRKTVIQGTRGQLTGDSNSFTVYDFNEKRKTTYTPPPPKGGHGGGDAGLSEAFWTAVSEQSQDVLGNTPWEMLNSHLMVFAAEDSRLTGRTVELDSFISRCLA